VGKSLGLPTGFLANKALQKSVWIAEALPADGEGWLGI
jgi:hypothetical protein